VGGAIGAFQRAVDDRVAQARKPLLLRARFCNVFLDYSIEAGVAGRLCRAAAVEQRIDPHRKSFDLRPLESEHRNTPRHKSQQPGKDNVRSAIQLHNLLEIYRYFRGISLAYAA
jgi:hypothetical protein